MLSLLLSLNSIVLLRDECISDKDFLDAVNVWNMFKMKTMGNYHDLYDLYLKTDVLLLADVFENFIGMCIEYYGLDPCYYFSSPGLIYDAMLKMTSVGLEIIFRTSSSGGVL